MAPASERSLLLPGASKSQKKLNESSGDYRRRWQSLGIGYAATFILSFQNSTFWASMYPYLSQIDPSASESFYGFVVAAFPLGAAISAPLLGIMSKRAKTVKIPILLGFILNFVGNFMMVFVEESSANRKWVLFVARLIGGFGTGCRSVISSYTVMSTKLEERNKGLSIQASASSAALMIGPGIQAAAVAIGYPGLHVGRVRVNMYTAPALFSMLLILVLSVLVLLRFKEYNMDVLDKKLTTNEAGVVHRARYTIESESEMPPYDKLAVFCCIFTRFCILFCETYDGTVGSPFTMTMFRWTSEEAVLYNGVLMACAGIVDFCGNLAVGNFLLRYVNERVTIIIGLISYLIFYIISFTYPKILPDLIDTDHNSSCTYEWCSYTTRIHLAQYIIAYAFITIAMSLAYTPSLILLSKVVGPRHQGFTQGINMAGGYIALIISPIIVSNVFDSLGPRVAWLIAASILCLGILTNGISFSRLKPYDRSKIMRRGTGVSDISSILALSLSYEC